MSALNLGFDPASAGLAGLASWEEGEGPSACELAFLKARRASRPVNNETSSGVWPSMLRQTISGEGFSAGLSWPGTQTFCCCNSEVPATARLPRSKSPFHCFSGPFLLSRSRRSGRISEELRKAERDISVMPPF